MCFCAYEPYRALYDADFAMAWNSGRLVILLRELARFYAQQLVEKNHYHQSSIAPPSPPLWLSICR
jgi:hypothetical protein